MSAIFVTIENGEITRTHPFRVPNSELRDRDDADVQAFLNPPKDYRQRRVEAYGSTAEQLEYLVENGVDALIARNNQIKSDNPKP